MNEEEIKSKLTELIKGYEIGRDTDNQNCPICGHDHYAMDPDDEDIKKFVDFLWAGLNVAMIQDKEPG